MILQVSQISRRKMILEPPNLTPKINFHSKLTTPETWDGSWKIGVSQNWGEKNLHFQVRSVSFGEGNILNPKVTKVLLQVMFLFKMGDKLSFNNCSFSRVLCPRGIFYNDLMISISIEKTHNISIFLYFQIFS